MKKLVALLGAFVVLVAGLGFATVQANSGPTMLVPLTASQVKEKVDNGEDFSVYVYSDTCVYCKQFSPVLEGYLKENDKHIYRVNTTSDVDHASLRKLLGDKFQGTPSIFSFQKGKIEDYLVGAQPKEKLVEYANKNAETFHVDAADNQI